MLGLAKRVKARILIGSTSEVRFSLVMSWQFKSRLLI